MAKQYRCAWFGIEELVPRHMFEEYGEKCWEFFDDRLLLTLDSLRDVYGPIYINDWKREIEWNGLRTPEYPNYRYSSQHNFGRAANMKFENWVAQEVIDDIIKQPKLAEFEHINALRVDVSWVHIDLRNSDRIKIVTP